MERTITNSLLEWKRRKVKKPLIVTGARQTGKTTTISQFGEENYDDFIIIDFYRQPEMKSAFSGNLTPNEILENISSLLRREINCKSTLLFLDEIQGCDEAITSLKYLNSDDCRVDVIAAGSLLGVYLARTGSFPVGYVDICKMHPLDFEEFCLALNEGRAFDIARDCYTAMRACSLHEHLMKIYRQYLLVGGMPEAVFEYTQSRSMGRVKSIQENINTTYLADMTKYIEGIDSSKVSECWTSIPSQLAKESGSTKFMWKYVAPGAKAERYDSAVDWLVAAGLLNKCTRITDGVSPLKSFEDPTSFKLYTSDTGLLANEYDATVSDFDAKDTRSARFRGGIAENYVMQQLIANGIKSYYWGTQSKREVEFIIKLGNDIVPIEVKSSTNTRSASIKYFAEKYNCKKIVKITGKNFGENEHILNVPLYAACMLKNTNDSDSLLLK